MSKTIDKNSSEKDIREVIRKELKRVKKKRIDLDRYFGKVNFGISGLEYQKKVRDEWR
jgi:hypothetical protein